MTWSFGLDRSDRKADLHLIDTRTGSRHVVFFSRSGAGLRVNRALETGATRPLAAIHLSQAKKKPLSARPRCSSAPYSPEFNAIEPIWHYVRMHATHNRYYASEQDFVAVLDRTLSAIVEHSKQVQGYLNPFL